MAAIASIVATGVIGAFAATETTLTASDTITIARGKCQLLTLRNNTGGALTIKIDGDAGTSVNIPGYGSGIDVSGGYQIQLADGAQKAVILSTISMWTGGTVSIKDGTGATVQLFDI